MKTVRVYKVQPTIKGDVVESVQIILDEEIPSFPLSIGWEEMEKYHDEEAKKLVCALWQTLPGGTLARLAAHLLLKVSGYLAVPLEIKEDDNKSG